MPEAAGIAYERTGAGPPLLLIHGLGATRGIWRPQIERLARERDVIAVDMPGFGESPVLDEAADALGDGRRDRRAPVARSGSSAPTSPATRSAAGSRSRWRRPATPRSLCLISPAGLWRKPLGPRSVNARRWAKRLRPALGAAVQEPAGPRTRC